MPAANTSGVSEVPVLQKLSFSHLGDHEFFDQAANVKLQHVLSRETYAAYAATRENRPPESVAADLPLHQLYTCRLA